MHAVPRAKTKGAQLNCPVRTNAHLQGCMCFLSSAELKSEGGRGAGHARNLGGRPCDLWLKMLSVRMLWS